MDLPILKKSELELLDAFWPERTPSVQDGERNIWIAVGRREVVVRLINEWKRAQEKKG